jgi:hypothetical protein
MKLHHFISAGIEESAEHLKQLGKAFTPTKTIRTVAEAAKTVPQKAAAIVKADKEGDLTQQMRDYAIQQLEGSEHCSHIHHKIKHYD